MTHGLKTIDEFKQFNIVNPIYLDYNANTPMDPEVAQEINVFIKSHFGNPSVRISTGRSTTNDEIDLAVEIMTKLLLYYKPHKTTLS
jgi:cysteine sulfinate desulfinase/cysteine desulfurase-like protein